MYVARKVIIVEGKTDKRRLLELLAEPVEVICTYGTLSEEKIEDMIVPLQAEEDVYILVDADDAGNKMRSQLKRELPNARHLYTRRMYREVATTPIDYLIEVLVKAHFEIKTDYML